MFSEIKRNLLWSQGRVILYFLSGAALLSLLLYPFFVYFILVLFLFSIYFFRYPQRLCKEALVNDAIIICPSDGKVVLVESDFHHGFEGYAQKISIFLSPLDVHVNWVPFAGVVQDMVYKKGTFKCAYLPKSSEFNERHSIYFRHSSGELVMVRQIAGMIARRICWWVNVHDTVSPGDTFGMIRFGSRVDILLPKQVLIKVKEGERVYGGQTVLGVWQ